MKNLRGLLVAPKPLIAICVILLLFSLVAMTVDFQWIAILRLVLTLVLYYLVLSGSRVAAYILAFLLMMAGVFALYCVYLLYATFGLQNFSLTYSKYLLYGVASIFCLASFLYIIYSPQVKRFYAESSARNS